MISAINSTRFASANNYKRTYTNTNQNNQNVVGYQQSFGMTKSTKATSILLGLVMAAIEAISPAQIARAEVDQAAAIAAKAGKKAKGLVQLMPDAVASATEEAGANLTGTVSNCAKGHFSNFVKSTLSPTSSFSRPPVHPCLIEDAQEIGKKYAAERGSKSFSYGFPDCEGHSIMFDYEDGKITSYSISDSTKKPEGTFGFANFEQRNYKDVNEDGTFGRMEETIHRVDGSIGDFKVWEKTINDPLASYDSVTSFPGSLPKAKLTHAKKANPAINNAQDGVFEFTTADGLKGNVEIKGGKIYSYEEIVPKADGEAVAHKYFDPNGNGAFEQYRMFYLDSNGNIRGTQTFSTEFDQDWIPYENMLVGK